MKWRRFGALALTLSLFLCGCQREDKPLETRSPDAEPTASYDWMAGESPVPEQRIGVLRLGTNAAPHAVSPSGVYFLQDSGTSNSYITYMDNGSDQIIKLCGRADCSHTGGDCNAYVTDAELICFYRGYLYVATLNDGFLDGACVSKLIRMDPDGSNRVTVLDLVAFAKEHDGDLVNYSMFTEGCLFFDVKKWVTTIETEEDGNESTRYHAETVQSYYFKLDGSMEEPQIPKNAGGLLYNSGGVALCYAPGESQNGGEFGGVWAWDSQTDTKEYLVDHPGFFCYFCREAAYYWEDGKVFCLDYKTGKSETLFDTGLKGTYDVLPYPECILVVESDTETVTDKTLYIYNWAYELVDQVKLDFEMSEISVAWSILAETAEQFILTNDFVMEPLYYIEKSELGTGNAVVHEFQRN